MSVAVMMFTLMDAVSKYLTQFYPVTYILWARFLTQTLLLMSVLSLRVGPAFLRTTCPRIQLVRGLLLPLASICFVSATKHMPIAEASCITFIGPLLVTLLSVTLLKEKVQRSQWAAILTGFIGVLIIIRPGTGVFTWASLLPLATAMCMAVYQVLTRRIAGTESAYTSIVYPGLIGTLIFSLTLPSSWTVPQTAWHVALLGLTGLISAASHLIFIKAFEFAPASRLAPFSYSQMVWATTVGYLVFGNFPDALTLVGIAILAAGGIYLAVIQRQS